MKSLWQKPSFQEKFYTMPLNALAGSESRIKHDKLFGLELEVEASNNLVVTDGLKNYWTQHTDNSLRGTALELVARVPFKFDAALEALDELEKTLKQSPNVSFSERTSFHVHINFGGNTVKHWHNFTSLFYLLEDAITLRSGGDNRVGNRFCLRTKDARSILSGIKRFFKDQNFRHVLQIPRYACLNHQAYHKFGSLEIRCHRGTSDVNEYRTFLKSLNEIYDFAIALPDIRQIFYDLSYIGYANWVRQKLPITYEYLINGGDSFTHDTIGNMIAACLVDSQEIAYGVDIIENVKMSSTTKPKKATSDEIEEEEIVVRHRAAPVLRPRQPAALNVDDIVAVRNAWAQFNAVRADRLNPENLPPMVPLQPNN